MQKTVKIEWADSNMVADPDDEMIAEMDKSMEYKTRRLDVLTRWAKKHPDRFIDHVRNAIANVTKKEYRKYASEIKTTGKRLQGEDGKEFREHSKHLTVNASGLTVYLTLKMKDLGYFEIAEAAGIDPEKIRLQIQARANIMYIKDIGANTLYSPKDAVSNKIFGGMEPGTVAPVVTIPTKKGNDYGAVLKLVQYKDEKSGTQIDIHYTKYEEYERAVCDAVASFVAEHGTPITISSEQIYRFITKNPKARLTLAAAKDIETAMINCGRGEVTIITDPAGDKELWNMGAGSDLEPEKKRYNVSSKYYGRMITFTAECSGEFDGALDRWTIYKAPILYDYAHDKKQIASTKIVEIEQPKAGKTRERTSKDTQSIDSYITRRIATMQKNPKQKRVILWENIYEIDGVYKSSTNPRTITNKQGRTRTKTIKILDKCVDRGMIKGYAYKDKEHMKLVGKNRQYYAIGIVI